MLRHCARFYSPAAVAAALPMLNDVNISFEGDSISSYTGNYTILTGETLSTTGRFNLTENHFAVAGSKLTDCVSRASSVDAAKVTGKTNILTVLIGTNDLAGGAYSGGVSAWLPAYASYLDARRAVYDYVVPLTIISRQGLTDTDRHAANAGIVGFTGIHCAAVADIGATSTAMGADGACNDTTLFVDYVHPTDLGYRHMRDDLIPTLRMVIGY
jgi:lysophospholipase L1-like esterase